MSRYFKERKLGFTIVEMLVSISILFIIASTVVLNQSRYTDGAALSNLAEELSLNISRAQSYGIGVREVVPGSSDFSASYGLVFSTSFPSANLAYVFFADRNDNQGYDGGWGCQVGIAEECVERVEMTGGNYVDSLCLVFTNGAPEDCSSVGRVDFIFTRPNVGVQFTFHDVNGSAFTPAALKGSKITLKSPKDEVRSVTLYTNGQIAVQ